MTTTLTTHLIKIGNSHGIRIPKLLIEQIGLDGEIEVEVQPGQLIVRPAAVQSARTGWDEQFAAMAMAGDDRLLDSDLVASDWDSRAWEW